MSGTDIKRKIEELTVKLNVILDRLQCEVNRDVKDVNPELIMTLIETLREIDEESQINGLICFLMWVNP